MIHILKSLNLTAVLEKKTKNVWMKNSVNKFQTVSLKLIHVQKIIRNIYFYFEFFETR